MSFATATEITPVQAVRAGNTDLSTIATALATEMKFSVPKNTLMVLITTSAAVVPTVKAPVGSPKRFGFADDAIASQSTSETWAYLIKPEDAYQDGYAYITFDVITGASLLALLA